MSTTIGALNVKVSATSAGFAEEMLRTEKAIDGVRASTARTQAAMNNMGGGSSKGGRAFLELSRGAEDFSAVYGTMGLGGALRASSNNLSQFASIIHPAAGAVAGLGIALGTVLIPKLFDTEKSAKQTERAIAGVKDSVAALRNEMERIADARLAIRDIGRVDNFKDAHAGVGKVKDDIAEVEAKMNDVAKARRELERGMIQGKPNAGILSGIIGISDGLTDADRKANKERKDAIAGMSKEMDDLKKKRLALDAPLQAAQKREGEMMGVQRGLNNLEEEEKRKKALATEEEKRKRVADDVNKLQRELLGELDAEAAKRQQIMDQWKEREALIDKSGLGDADNEKLKSDAYKSAYDRLNPEDGKAAMDKVRDLERQADAIRNIVPVQAALQRGSSAEVSMNNRTMAKDNNNPQLSAIVNEIKKLRQDMKLGNGKVELVQGNF